MKKRILSLALTLTLILALIPAAAASTLTEGDYTYTVSGGNATITRYTGSGGAVTIPSTLGGHPVTRIDDNAFQGSALTSTTIPDSVTSVGGAPFVGTPWMNNQPNGVLYLGDWCLGYKGTMPNNLSVTVRDGTKGIADFAFGDYFGSWPLISVTFPNSLLYIGGHAFSRTLLTSVDIPNGVISIGDRAFNECTLLASVTIPNSVTYMSVGTFGGCNRDILTIRLYENSYAHKWVINSGNYWKTEFIGGTPPPPPPLFGDLAGVSSEGLANIEFVYENGLMAGSGGNFMPTQAARNAQFLAILSRLAGAGVTDGSPWFAPYVDWARDFGIIEAGEFNADGDMAREDMALWMYRYITISGIELPSVNGKPDYQDIAGLSEEQRVAAEALYDWGIIRGSNPGVTFGTGDSSERVALANVLARFVRMLP